MTIRHLLECKDRCLCSISPKATVLEAVTEMANRNVGSLLVMHDDKLVGLITERHYARNVVLKGKASGSTPVEDIMERNVIHVTPEQSVELCMAIMTEKRIRHLPVLEGDKVIGIVSIGDLLKFMISKKETDIGQLEHYIQGDGWQTHSEKLSTGH
jgi:signal-transduction protein with cAMP-binding, CBS, and nucleotidyltransferase domain